MLFLQKKIFLVVSLKCNKFWKKNVSARDPSELFTMTNSLSQTEKAKKKALELKFSIFRMY